MPDSKPAAPVTVRFTVSLFGDDAPRFSNPPIFTHWLPIGRKRGVRFTHNDHSGLLWFELESSRFSSDEAEIARLVNVAVDKAFIEIGATVDGELGDWMKKRDFRKEPTAAEEALAERYFLHGKQVLAALSHGLNRFLSYVRIEKGQYWVRPIVLDPDHLSSHAVGMNAKARVGDGDWFRWHPTHVMHLRATMVVGSDRRYVSEDDWDRVQEFVGNNRRPTLALELLAGAEALARDDSERAALTEAVSALEIALAKFGRGAKVDALLPSSIRERLGVSSLHSLIEHMGVTASVSIVLPFLFSETQLPANLLSTCREAIAQRQSVVHQGQRTIESTVVIKQLAALRQLIELLLRHTAAE
jgi:hypothetical protein